MSVLLRTCAREWRRARAVIIVDRSPMLPAFTHRVLTIAAAASVLAAFVVMLPHPVNGPKHPVPASPVRALPSLERSDDAVRQALARLPGSESVAPLLPPSDLVRVFVERVDEVAAGTSPASRASIAAIASLDEKRAATLYARLYPLLQEAYEQRAPGRGYFNDRLVQAIDRVLEQGGGYDAASGARLREMRRLVALRAPGG